MELEDKKNLALQSTNFFYSFPVILHGPMMKDTSNIIFCMIYCFYMNLKHLKSTILAAPLLLKT